MLISNFQSALLGQIEPYFALSIENGLKELLEAKHLYQNKKIEPLDKNIIRRELNKYMSGSTSNAPNITDIIDLYHSLLSEVEWVIKNPGRRNSLPLGVQGENVYASIEFTPPTAKLLCGTCKRIEAYNFLHGQDLLGEFRGAKSSAEPVKEQIFSLVYQCQSCKSIPEVFIVRRDNLKLIQSGRTPIEEIEIPTCIPKTQKKYFSDATIAFNSGQILAGNFLLRAFIEQYVRSLSSSPDSQNIDALFLEYGKGLPDDFKQRFPSLQSVYDKLSGDLHMATASENVFLQARIDIVKHFKARDLFEL